MASNSNQGSPNTQTLPTLTLFLPLQVHGLWLVLLQSSHWKSDNTTIIMIGGREREREGERERERVLDRGDAKFYLETISPYVIPIFEKI